MAKYGIVTLYWNQRETKSFVYTEWSFLSVFTLLFKYIYTNVRTY